jgi:hypothetical protein
MQIVPSKVEQKAAKAVSAEKHSLSAKNMVASRNN